MSLDFTTWKNIESLPKQNCFGCAVCADICPENCIVMTHDFEGFAYPQVDDECCIACGKCLEACPALNTAQRQGAINPPSFFAGYTKDEDLRFQSSSGGIFSLVADQILAQQGIVYGAVYNFTEMTVIHARATSQDGLAAMRKSKYVQSDTGHIFRLVKKDLQAGTPVLFSGTPCQVEGLRLYLRESYENLFTCDFICHGVPSPGLFTRHFKNIEKRDDAPIIHIDFRTKEKGWGSFLNFYLEVATEKKRHLTYAPLDAFYALFLANLILRPVCYQCPYANLDRKSDITIGDFWGVNKTHPDLYDDKGTSLILVNTVKGRKMIHSLAELLAIQSVENLETLPPNLQEPTNCPNIRERFFRQTIQLDEWPKDWFKVHLLAISHLINNKLKALLRN